MCTVLLPPGDNPIAVNKSNQFIKSNLNILDRFSKNSQMSNLMKILQWDPSCSVWTDRDRERERDRQTDMTKLIVTFRNFANAPKHGNIQKESTETRLSPMPNISQFNSNSRKIYKLRNKIGMKQSLQNFTNLFEKLQKKKRIW